MGSARVFQNEFYLESGQPPLLAQLNHFTNYKLMLSFQTSIYGIPILPIKLSFPISEKQQYSMCISKYQTLSSLL